MISCLSNCLLNIFRLKTILVPWTVTFITFSRTMSYSTGIASKHRLKHQNADMTAFIENLYVLHWNLILSSHSQFFKRQFEEKITNFVENIQISQHWWKQKWKWIIQNALIIIIIKIIFFRTWIISYIKQTNFEYHFWLPESRTGSKGLTLRQTFFQLLQSTES